MEIFAHRGASDYEFENSKEAILKAIEIGAKGIEFDVQLTSDDRLVLFHDYDLKGHFKIEKKVKDVSFEYLKKLSFEKKRVTLITLEEALKIIPEDVKVNIEIKKEFFTKGELVEKTVEVILKSRRKNYFVSSFNHLELIKLRKRNSDIPISILIDVKVPLLRVYFKILKKLKIEPYSININSEIISDDHVNLARELACKLYLYTVNSEKDLNKKYETVIDGIFSDIPDRVYLRKEEK